LFGLRRAPRQAALFPREWYNFVMANVKLILESEWAHQTLKEVSSLLQPDRAGDLPPEISDRLSSFLKSPGEMFTFDSQPCAGADGERRILLNPSDGLLHFLHALRKWNREEQKL